MKNVTLHSSWYFLKIIYLRGYENILPSSYKPCRTHPIKETTNPMTYVVPPLSCLSLLLFVIKVLVRTCVAFKANILMCHVNEIFYLYVLRAFDGKLSHVSSFVTTWWFIYCIINNFSQVLEFWNVIYIQQSKRKLPASLLAIALNGTEKSHKPKA